MFPATLLAVCSLGSRFSYDRRILLSGDKTWLSSGWSYFSQTHVLDDAGLGSQPSHLHLLQSICVRVLQL